MNGNEADQADGDQACCTPHQKAKGKGATGAGADDGTKKPKLKGMKWKKLKNTVKNKEALRQLKEKSRKTSGGG